MAPDSDSGNLHGDADGVIIKTFPNRDAAELAASQLEANGIACWISSDDCGGMYPNLALAEGVRVWVSPADAEPARELLDSPGSSAEPPAEMPAVPPPDEGPPPGKISIPQILLGVIIGAFAMWLCQEPARPSPAVRYHYNTEGKMDGEWIHDHGRVVEYQSDRNLDGSFDRWTYYDEKGDVEHSDYDNNFDGKVDMVYHYRDGELTTSERDTDFNGIFDEFCTYKDGLIQQLDVRPNGSELVTVREIFMNGVLTEIQRDGGGKFKEVVEYGPFFNPVRTNTIPYPLLSKP